MKVSASKAQGFLRQVPGEIRGVLIYGPDAGRVRDSSAALTTAIVGDSDDPFRVSVMQPDSLTDGSLLDEFNALTFGAGRRIVNLRNAVDTATPHCLDVLELGRGENLLVVEAGDLPPRSKLRGVFEKADTGAAVPCYGATLQDVQSLATQVLFEHGVAASPRALDAVGRHLGADHLVSRRELEKLALYCAGTGKVEEDDVTAVLADVAALSLDDVVNAVADGNIGRIDHLTAQLFDEKTAGVAIIRAVARHFLRLWQVQAAIGAGKATDAALSSLRPPLFWKAKDAFRRQLRRWSVDHLMAASRRLIEAEIALKSTGIPERSVTERCLLSVAGIPRHN